MTELQIYDTNGLFHNIAKESKIMDGRYAVLPKGAHDLNINNLLSSLDLPKDKYPGIFCLPPISDIPGSIAGQWESFIFRLLFLCKTNVTGDNKIKLPDRNTNTSQHTIQKDWNDMKIVALGFMNSLETIQRKMLSHFRLTQQSTWRIIRVSGVQNDNLSGVMLQFNAALGIPCSFTDIDVNNIQLPDINTPNHPQHFH